MNATSPFSIGRLVTGISRLSVREAHTKARMGRTNTNPTRNIKGRRGPKPDVSYGEMIWLFNHTANNHVIYSHTAPLKANKALRQIPFNGKKMKPASVRKDYWRLMAMIHFPKGCGEVGRSVFQKLREFRKRHELEWGDKERVDELRKLVRPWRGGKQELGKALNDQKANSVADMAAVLGGAGKGNRIWAKPRSDEDAGELHTATIYWADELDQTHAQSWPDNVRHVAGIPEMIRPGVMRQIQETGKETQQKTPEAQPSHASTPSLAAIPV